MTEIKPRIDAVIFEVDAFETLRVEPVQEGVCVDDDPREDQCADRQTVSGTSRCHRADFGFLNTHLIEVFGDADSAEEGTVARSAGCLDFNVSSILSFLMTIFCVLCFSVLFLDLEQDDLRSFRAGLGLGCAYW